MTTKMIAIMNEYTSNDNFWKNPFDRRNEWDFSYYGVTVLYYILSDFANLVKIPENTNKSTQISQLFNDGYKILTQKKLNELLDILHEYRIYFESESVNNIREDDERILAEKVIWALHKIASILPYLSLSYFPKREIIEEKQALQSGFSIYEISYSNKLIADRILPVLRTYKNLAINAPYYFDRFYTSDEGYEQWKWTIGKMITSFEWISHNHNNIKNEDVPNEVVFGLHSFAQYLIEMYQP